MVMGRPRKPMETKILEGTFRKDRMHVRIEGEKLTEVPEAPKYLNDEQKIHYENVIKGCIELGTMTVHDVYICIEMALVIYELIWATIDINENGRTQLSNNGYEQIRPVCGIRDRALDKFIKLSNLMGMNASAREKLTMDKKEPENELTKLLNERNG